MKHIIAAASGAWMLAILPFQVQAEPGTPHSLPVIRGVPPESYLCQPVSCIFWLEALSRDEERDWLDIETKILIRWSGSDGNRGSFGGVLYLDASGRWEARRITRRDDEIFRVWVASIAAQDLVEAFERSGLTIESEVWEAELRKRAPSYRAAFERLKHHQEVATEGSCEGFREAVLAVDAIARTPQYPAYFSAPERPATGVTTVDAGSVALRSYGAEVTLRRLGNPALEIDLTLSDGSTAATPVWDWANRLEEALAPCWRRTGEPWITGPL